MKTDLPVRWSPRLLPRAVWAVGAAFCDGYEIG